MSFLQKMHTFVTKYADEIGTVGDVLQTIVGYIPMESGDRDRMQGKIGQLDDAVDNILESLEGLQKSANSSGAKVSIKKSDVEAAVKSVLEPMVDKAVAKALKEAAKDAKK